MSKLAKSKTFIVSMFFTVVMVIIWMFFDFNIGGFLWFHMLPEVAGLYFLGMFSFEEKMSFKIVFLIFLFMAITTPLLVGSNPYWAGVFIVSVLGTAFLLGFGVARLTVYPRK